MNVKIIDPELTYLHIDNCVDMQKIYSDFNTLLDQYPNEEVIANIYEFYKHKCDSIAHQIMFFVNLEKDELQIKETLDGSVSKFTNDFPIIGRLYAELNEGEYLVLDEIGNPQYRSNNTEVLVQVSKITNDKIVAQSQYWKKINMTSEEVQGLKDVIGLRSLSTWFIMFWLEKFRTSVTTVRDAVLSTLGESEFYRPFSESIGNLKNIEFIKIDKTLKITDTSVPEGSIPYTYPGCMNYITSDNEKRVSLELSRNVNTVFRTNIQNITCDYDKTNTTTSYAASHAADLRVDTDHHPRMSAVVSKIHTTLQQELEKMYDVLMFISNNSNAMLSPKVIYKKHVESNLIDIDLLKSKVKKVTTAYRSNELLGVN